ncbi:MAG: N-acetyltransferase [Thermomicrobiales bacterium]|nr:N-acetyltransferase [Thermomicrobiales bacterium]
MHQADATWRIRFETPADHAAIRTVNREAFGGEAEAILVDALRDEGDALFGLVAEAAGDIVGHILFSRLPIAMGNGDEVVAAALAPLAVLPAWQRRGIGSALAREGLARCKELGVPAVVVLGDPGYYTRFGFRPELARGLASPWSGPHLMALEITPGGLAGGHGAAHYADAFRMEE